MTDKEMADRIDAILTKAVGSSTMSEELLTLRNELAPPKPEPRTLVWHTPPKADDWRLGYIDHRHALVDIETGYLVDQTSLRMKPARVLGPRQVAVDVDDARIIYELAGLVCSLEDIAVVYRFRKAIERAEAERMEAEDD